MNDLPDDVIDNFKKKEYDICREKCKKIIVTNPKNGTALMYLGCIAQSEKEYDTAIDYFKKVIEIEPNFPFIWGRIGEIHFELERFKEAFDAFVEEIAIYGKQVGPWCMASACAQKMGQYYVASELLKLAKERVEEKDQSIISYTLGILEEIVGNKDEALMNYMQGQLDAKNEENRQLSARRIYRMLTKSN